MGPVVTNSVGLLSLVACRSTGTGEHDGPPNGKALDKLSKGPTNRTSAVPDRQGIRHALGRNLTHLMVKAE